MRGDAEYAGKHQHGIQEAGRASSGAHLPPKAAAAGEPKRIKQTSVAYRGHLQLTFEDDSTLLLERGQYDMQEPPKVGEMWPRGSGSLTPILEAARETCPPLYEIGKGDEASADSETEKPADEQPADAE